MTDAELNRAVAPKRLSASKFLPNHCAESNRVFLWQAHSEPPFMCAVPGWKIVGYGKAPWQKNDLPIAVMFERITAPSNPYGNIYGDECAEGTRIWQHGKKEWVPGLPECETRTKRAVRNPKG